MRALKAISLLFVILVLAGGCRSMTGESAGQNIDGFSFARPNTAGSEPSGSSVADTNEMMKTVLRPNCGSASAVSS